MHIGVHDFMAISICVCQLISFVHLSQHRGHFKFTSIMLHGCIYILIIVKLTKFEYKYNILGLVITVHKI